MVSFLIINPARTQRATIADKKTTNGKYCQQFIAGAWTNIKLDLIRMTPPASWEDDANRV